MVVRVRPVVDRIRRLVAWRSRRSGYRHLRVLDDFARQAADITNLRSLAATIERVIPMTMGAQHARLLVPESDGLRFTPVSSWHEGSSTTLELETSSPIVTWLRFHNEPLSWQRLQAEPGYLPLSSRQLSELEEQQVQLLVPLKHREELAGILVLTSKSSGQAYSDEDRTLLLAAADKVSMWVLNAGLFARLAHQKNRLERLLDLAVGAREEERKHIAVELHDSPVQWLTSAAYRLEACLEQSRRGKVQVSQDDLEEIQRVLNRTLDELRHTASGLFPPELEKVGLAKALARYADAFERDTGILTRFSEDGTLPRLGAPVELAAYRVVQEALSNVRKHSRATEVKLSMGLHHGTLWAAVVDNGIGLDPEGDGLPRNGHLGLAGMEERAYMLGGTLGIQSTPLKGTRITLLIPDTRVPDVSEEIPVHSEEHIRGMKPTAGVVE